MSSAKELLTKLLGKVPHTPHVCFGVLPGGLAQPGNSSPLAQSRESCFSPQEVHPTLEPAWQLLRTPGELQLSASSSQPLPSQWPQSQTPLLLRSCGSFLPLPEQSGLASPWNRKPSPAAAQARTADSALLSSLCQPTLQRAHKLGLSTAPAALCSHLSTAPRAAGLRPGPGDVLTHFSPSAICWMR